MLIHPHRIECDRNDERNHLSSLDTGTREHVSGRRLAAGLDQKKLGVHATGTTDGEAGFDFNAGRVVNELDAR
jgi:hypothetical protein